MTRYVDGQHQDTGASSDGRSGDSEPRVPFVSTADIYRRLAELGVTPEQAAAGVRLAALVHSPCDCKPCQVRRRVTERAALVSPVDRIVFDNDHSKPTWLLVGAMLGMDEVCARSGTSPPRGCPCDDGDGEGCHLHGFGAP